MVIGKNRIIDMTQGPIAKGLILYSIPIILSDFLQQIYSTVDSIIVGNYVGAKALAAVGETFFITNMFLGFFLGISLGCTVALSKAFGARDKLRLANSLDASLKLTVVLSIVFTFMGIELIPALLKLAGTTEDIYEDAFIYLRIIFAGLSTQLVYNMLSSILKAIGDSKRPLYVLAFTAGLNVILDIIFVKTLSMGVSGAAYATIISQFVSDIILWIMLRKTDLFEKPFFRGFKTDFTMIKDILKVGIPFSAQRTIISFSNMVVVSYVNRFGSMAMAAWTAYQKIDQFVISTIFSLSSGLTSFVAQNAGAGFIDRIRKGTKVGMLLTVIMSAFYGVILIIFRYELIGLFNQDPEVVSIGVSILWPMITVQIANAVPQVQSGALRGLGKSFWPTAILIFSFVLCRQVYLYLRWPTFQDIMIIVGSFHLTWVIAFIIMFIYNRRTMKKLDQLV